LSFGDDMDERYFRIKEVVARYGLTPQYWRLHSSGGKAPLLKFTRIGGRIFYKLVDVEEFIARQNSQASTESN
jgi:hypothetical protein